MKRKGSRRDRPEEEEIVQCSFLGNTFQGSLARSALGAWSADSHATDAKYNWQGSGIQYEGQMVSSSPQGHGRFLWPDGSKYEGEVLTGKRHGHGVFTAADGIVTYAGEWAKGLRHGRGRLCCDQSGEAFYDGDWLEGEKHGDGRQVWSSGNCYEGQWSRGSKSGFGTMTWRQSVSPIGSAAAEKYTGQWQHDSPHGNGCYTWLTPPPNKKDALKDMPLVQMNNHYIGEWVQGIRHGKGIFQYASGAKYDGMWERGVKHGHGRYTSEDGCVYEGDFENDRMADAEMERGMLSRDENPIRNKIDIRDLELVSSTGPHATKEVCNLLLRHLPELKQAYCRYRLQLPMADGDRFMLSSHQLWLYARDHNLITPECSIGQLDRFIFQGARHHQETDFQEATQNRRPLTPRRRTSVHRKSSKQLSHNMTRTFSKSHDSPVHVNKKGTLKLEELQLECLAEEGEQDGDGEAVEAPPDGSDVSDASSEYTGTDSRSSSTAGSRRQTRDEALETADVVETKHVEIADADGAGGEEAGEKGQDSSPRQQERRTTHLSRQPFPLFSHFWRPEGSDKLLDIHAPRQNLLFRHFLEAIVRMSVVCFPHENGLDVRVRALVKSLLLPCAGPKRSSVQCFAFAADEALQEVLASCQPLLWEVFKHCAAGVGSYDTPHWIPEEVLVQAEEDAAKAVGVDWAPRVVRRGWGGQSRRSHCGARLDVTMRIKDLLRLLSRLGLLKPASLAEDALAQGRSQRVVQTSNVGDDANAPRHLLFPELIAKRAEAEDEVVDIAPSATSRAGHPFAGRTLGATAVLEAADRSAESPSGQQETMVKRRSLADSSQPQSRVSPARRIGSTGALPQSPRPQMSQSLQDHASEEQVQSSFSRQVTAGTQEGAVGSEAADGDDEIDASLDMLAVCRILAETLSPASLQKLTWTMSSTGFKPESGMVSLLEWIETELTFAEFQRFLVRMVETKYLGVDENARAQSLLPQKLHDFLTNVFMSGMKGSDVLSGEQVEPPLRDATQGEEQDEAAAGATQMPTQGTDRPHDPAASGLQQGTGLAPTQPPETEAGVGLVLPPTSELWHGYSGACAGEEDVEEQSMKLTKRVWPASYVADVVDW